MNKILVFGITENPGGVESVVMNYYRHIDNKKIQFDFLCNTYEKVAYEDEIIKLGGKIHRITARSKDRNKYKEEMKKFFEQYSKEYNTIWVNVCSLANIDYLKYAKKYGIKYRIIHSHNSQNMDSKLRKVLHKLNKLVIKKYATDFWACSDEAGEWFYNKKIMNSDKYLVVNNAIDTNKFMYNEEIRKEYRKELNIEDKFVIGNVGRLHFQKNQEFLLDIFNEILKIDKKACLLLVGQGEDEEKLRNKVKKLEIENSVKFLGVRDDVPNLLQAMDSFVFPSVFEGLGLAIIEAEATGINVFASKSVIPELVNMSDEFHFIPLEDGPEKWAEKVISNKEYDRIETMKKAVKNIENSGYDIATETKKVERYFERR